MRIESPKTLGMEAARKNGHSMTGPWITRGENIERHCTACSAELVIDYRARTFAGAAASRPCKTPVNQEDAA